MQSPPTLATATTLLLRFESKLNSGDCVLTVRTTPVEVRVSHIDRHPWELDRC